jgi:hypothetical protein
VLKDHTGAHSEQLLASERARRDTPTGLRHTRSGSHRSVVDGGGAPHRTLSRCGRRRGSQLDLANGGRSPTLPGSTPPMIGHGEGDYEA